MFLNFSSQIKTIVHHATKYCHKGIWKNIFLRRDLIVRLKTLNFETFLPLLIIYPQNNPSNRKRRINSRQSEFYDAQWKKI